MPRLAPVIKTVLFEIFMSFLLFEIRTSVCYYAARKAEDTRPDLSGDFARNDGARGRQNPGAVDVIHDANDSVIRDFETDEGSRRPPDPIPEVDDDRRFAIHAPQREAPRLRPAMVVGEIGGFGERTGETIRYLEPGVGADQFTNSVPVLTIESIYIELKNAR
jgi:hypothetical protein